MQLRQKLCMKLIRNFMLECLSILDFRISGKISVFPLLDLVEKANRRMTYQNVFIMCGY